MKDGEEILGLAEDAVKRARALGADGAEVFVNRYRSTMVGCVGRFALPKESHGLGVGVRVAIGRKVGVAGTSGLARLDAVLAEALAHAKRFPEHDRFRRFAPPTRAPVAATRVHPSLDDIDPSRLEDAAEATMAGLVADRRTAFASVSVTASNALFAVANSEGVAAWDRHGAERLHIEARVSDGREDITASDTAASRVPIADTLDVARFGAEAVERAGRCFGARALDGRVDEVVLAPPAAGQLVNLFEHALSAARVQARQSPLAGKVGEVVASPALTLRDLARGKMRVDHEGVPTEDVVNVREGRLETLLYDSASAIAEDRASNGHGLRPSGWSGGVGIKAVNLRVEPGPDSFDALVEGADRAVVVTDPFHGSFTSNDVTGDFSLVAPYAFLVERGRVARPLPATSVAGNVHALLQDLRGVGRDLREFATGSFPALRAGGVACAT